MLTTFIVCALAALAGGLIDAISGGGGLLTIPALLLCGVPPHTALGTNKVSACLGTTVALFNFAANHLVDWRLVACGIGFSLSGSWIGAMLAMHLEAEFLGKVLIALLPFGMLATILPQKKNGNADQEIRGLRFWLLLPLACLCIGMYDGFFGPGTGSFLILALHWVLGMGLVRASATAKAFNLGSNVSGAVSFIWHGVVNWPLALVMGACFMGGNWLGSSLAIRVGARIVRRFLFLSLFLLLSTLIWQYFFK